MKKRKTKSIKVLAIKTDLVQERRKFKMFILLALVISNIISFIFLFLSTYMLIQVYKYHRKDINFFLLCEIIIFFCNIILLRELMMVILK